MQVIISPAKQMSADSDAFAPHDIPPFPDKTDQILRALRAIERDQGPQGLQALWGVSVKLLAENIERLHAFAPIMDARGLDDPALARLVAPAIFSYVGIQYQNMAPGVLDERALAWLQEHLWILSGLYGCARPFDAVQPYRLEMGAKLAVGDAKNLYAFWGDALACAVCGDPCAVRPSAHREAGDATRPEVPPAGDPDRGSACIVNLASVEYAKAVLPHLADHIPIVTCVFSSSLRNGKPVQKSTESKAARGTMVRWMAEMGAEGPDDLKRFDMGFRFAPELSNENGPRQTFVFMKR